MKYCVNCKWYWTCMWKKDGRNYFDPKCFRWEPEQLQAENEALKEKGKC